MTTQDVIDELQRLRTDKDLQLTWKELEALAWAIAKLMKELK